MTAVVPPHKGWESPNPVVEAFKVDDKEVREAMQARWHDALDAMLPPYTHLNFGERKWTTPAGLWSVIADYRGGHWWPEVKVLGPGVSVVLRDPNLAHVRSVLTVLGAIEPEPEVLS